MQELKQKIIKQIEELENAIKQGETGKIEEQRKSLDKLLEEYTKRI